MTHTREEILRHLSIFVPSIYYVINNKYANTPYKFMCWYELALEEGTQV